MILHRCLKRIDELTTFLTTYRLLSAYMNIDQLYAEASNYEFSTSVNFLRWLHTLRTILLQANSSRDNGDLETAFVLYLRYADLALNKLRRHPDFKKYKSKYDSQIKGLSDVIGQAESIKKELKAAHPPSQLGKSKSDDLHENTKETALPEAEPVELGSEMGILQSLRSAPSAGAAITNLHFQYQKPKISKPGSQTQPSVASAVRPPPLSTCIQHKSKAATEGGTPLRTVFLPAGLREKFLQVAEPNTRKDLETCGVLCGKLNKSAFFITQLVIPHQESTSNTCSTTNEEALFEYVQSNDLFILGWIHTHPSQSCFMSSIDLHTQNSYQLMLPEAIAIVCAPKHNPDWGAFRLSDPPGVEIIKRCRQTGFHPHNEAGVYKSAIPGHVVTYKFDFITKDLRGT